MTTAHNIDLPTVLAERLTTAHPDVLRDLLTTFIHALMGAEADALCGAGYGNAVPSAATPATATGSADSTPAQAHRWSWRSPSCVRAPISRTGCWNAASVAGGH